MTWKNRFVEVVVQSATMLACAGAVIAAGFTVDSIQKLENNSSLVDEIDRISGNIRLRLMISTVLAIASGLAIPLGVVMILISLCKINLGVCKKCCVATDILLILLAACGYGGAGALGALTAKHWSDGVLVKIPDTDIVREIRTDIFATAGCSLLACGACLFLLLVVVVQYIRYHRHLNQERTNYKFTDYMSLKVAKV